MNNEPKTLEETFTNLDKLIKEMEDPQLSLEETFTKYAAGMELIKQCNSSIDRIEQQLTILEENNI